LSSEAVADITPARAYGACRTALAKYLIKGPEADDAIEIQACFASEKTAISMKLKDVQGQLPLVLAYDVLCVQPHSTGRATANEKDSLTVYIQYKPAPFFKLLVPLVCFELETSQVDRLEVGTTLQARCNDRARS
jgi:hypothetical protein